VSKLEIKLFVEILKHYEEVLIRAQGVVGELAVNLEGILDES
jgi:hypothetical protein